MVDHFYKGIHGWFNYQSLYSEMIHRYPSGSHFVEVGAWLGQSAAFMAVEIINSKKEIQFDCVDAWVDCEHEEFLDNIKPVAHIINPIKLLSTDAAKLYEDKSLDFIFIDADHTYESVKQDIISWRPKLKDEGIMAGHDYNEPSVKKAVKEMFGERTGTCIRRRCWIVEP